MTWTATEREAEFSGGRAIDIRDGSDNLFCCVYAISDDVAAIKQMRARAKLIVQADEHVNILRFVMIVQQIIEAHDTGNIAFDSPEIGGHDDLPPHRWHEEWLYSAKQALATIPHDTVDRADIGHEETEK